MGTLYDLGPERRWILDLLDDPSADSVSISEALQAIDGEIEDKVHDIVQMVREMEARRDARYAESKRLTRRAEVANNAAESLKKYLHLCMRDASLKKVETDNFRVTRCANGGKQSVTVAEDLVPEEFMVREGVVRVDVEKIRAALEAGRSLEFAEFVERGEHLRIL